jgi:hypothetical protein
MFEQIGRCVPYDDWGLVQLINGNDFITLYEEMSTAKHITMTPSTGERGFKFDEDFMEGMTTCGVGERVHLEITKRLTAEDEAVLRAALAETLSARFQSITWV